MRISDINQKILIGQQRKKRLIDNSYLKDKNNPNFQYCKNKRFFNESIDKLKLLNVGSGLFQSIVDIFSFYVGKKDSNFSYRRYIEDFLTLGFFCYSLERNEKGELNIVYQPSENYINNNGVDTMFRKYINTEDKLQTEYLLSTTFIGGIIENKLYKASMGLSVGDLTLFTKEVPLDTINDTAGLQPYINTGLPQVFFLYKEDKTEQFPVSLISKIENMVYSLDRKILLLDLQFLQHGEVFRIFKDLEIPVDMLDSYATGKSIDFAKLGTDIISRTGEGTIEYVSNKNELIDKILEQNENDIRKISAITNIPVDFLGLDSREGNIGQGSRTLLQGIFLKKIIRLRSMLDKAFEGFENIIGGDIWEDIFIKNDNDLINELKTAREVGLISQLNAIQNYLGVDKIKAQKEFEQILNEKKMMSDLIINNQNANTFGQDNQENSDNEDASDTE